MHKINTTQMFSKTHQLSLTKINKKSPKKTFYALEINTTINPLLAIADDKALYSLSFINDSIVESTIKFLNFYSANIVFKSNKILDETEKQLNKYFKKELKQFSIPLKLTGTDFQKQVWHALLEIPYGKTISYLEEASNINNPKAFRAVANANGKNPISIIIPCHRVINNNGKLGGYTGGLDKKIFLLKLEK